MSDLQPCTTTTEIRRDLLPLTTSTDELTQHINRLYLAGWEEIFHEEQALGIMVGAVRLVCTCGPNYELMAEVQMLRAKVRELLPKCTTCGAVGKDPCVTTKGNLARKRHCGR